MQRPFHSPCSQPPVVPTKVCQPVQVDAFITVLSLSCCGEWAGTRVNSNDLAREPRPPVSLKAHSSGSHASLPFLQLLYKSKNVLRCSSLIPLPPSLGTVVLHSSKGAGLLPSRLFPGVGGPPVCVV